MHCKKLLTWLLVLCMMVSLVAPAAVAATASTDQGSVSAGQKPSVNNSLMANGSTSRPTLRDFMENLVTGNWSATKVENPGVGSMASASLSDTLDELKKAAQMYDENDIVSAFRKETDAEQQATHSRTKHSNPKAKSAVISNLV